ncbi:MAG: hypothetical protein ACOYM5_15510 [Caulobacter sp.]
MGDAMDFRSGRNWQKNFGVMAAIVVFAALAIICVLAAAASAAGRVDSVSIQHEEQLVANGLNLKNRSLRDCISPNVMWDDAVLHLDNRFNAS